MGGELISRTIDELVWEFRHTKVFVYVGFANKAVKFCLFMLVLQTKLFVSFLCQFHKQSRLLLFVYLTLVNKAVIFCLMLNKVRNEAAFVFSLCLW